MGNTNRTRGHNWERWLIKHIFNPLYSLFGQTIKSSRAGSKLADDKGFDFIIEHDDSITMLPFQAKSTQSFSKDMLDYCDNGQIVFWKKMEKREKKQVEKGKYMLMSMDVGMKMLSMMIKLNKGGNPLKAKINFVDQLLKEENKDLCGLDGEPCGFADNCRYPECRKESLRYEDKL